MSDSVTDRLFAAVAYIEAHLTEAITIDDVCRAACYSRYHFQRLFHAAAGIPVGQYIRRRRITECARALTDTDRAILPIALDYQFNSHEHFSRTFRAHIGLSPSDFRAQRGARAPRFLAPLQRNNLHTGTERPNSFMGWHELPEAVWYRHRADGVSQKAIGALFGRTAAHIGPNARMAGMITYPADIVPDMPYGYSVIASQPGDGAHRITLPACRAVRFRYCGPLRELPALYRWIYCIWMDRQDIRTECDFDLEFFPNTPPRPHRAEVILTLPVSYT
ncbi:MAG: helix-turn-helix domain-containing protein [Fibrobacterota bacterium]